MVVIMFLSTVLALSMVPQTICGPTELWRVFDVKGVDPELVPSKFPPPLPPFHPPTTDYPPKPDPEDMVQWYKYAAEKKPKMSMEASNAKRRKESNYDGDDNRPMPRMPQSEVRPRLDQEDDEGNFNPEEWSWNSQQSFQDDSLREGRESRPKKYNKSSRDDDNSPNKRFVPEEMIVKPKENQRQLKWSSPSDENEQRDVEDRGQNNGQNSNDNHYDGGSSVPANEYVRRQMELLMSRKRQNSPQSEGSDEDDNPNNWENEDQEIPEKMKRNKVLTRKDDPENVSRFTFDREPEINPYEYRSMKRNGDNNYKSNSKHFGMPEDTDSTNFSPKKQRVQNK